MVGEGRGLGCMELRGVSVWCRWSVSKWSDRDGATPEHDHAGGYHAVATAGD